jgi:hypothetical protein
MTGKARRFEREIAIGGETYRACVAWRGRETGFGLLYFHPVGEAADDRADLRALLAPGEGPDRLTDARLRELFDEARPLTVTERRFTAGDGRRWLAQNRGPVWAERSAAEGHTGIVFTSLEDEVERVSSPGRHVAEMSDDELGDLLRASRAGPGQGTRAPE